MSGVAHWRQSATFEKKGRGEWTTKPKFVFHYEIAIITSYFTIVYICKYLLNKHYRKSKHINCQYHYRFS